MSNLTLMNSNGKKLVIDSGSALEDKQIQSSDIAYTRTTIEDMMNIPSPSNNEVCVVTEEGRGGNFVYDGNSWKRQSVVIASATKLWKINIDDAGIITTTKVV